MIEAIAVLLVVLVLLQTACKSLNDDHDLL